MVRNKDMLYCHCSSLSFRISH